VFKGKATTRFYSPPLLRRSLRHVQAMRTCMPGAQAPFFSLIESARAGALVH